MAAQTIQKSVDRDWIELIKQAKHLGLSIEEVRRFIAKSSE
ncbi:anti-repressor SinI family protein [Halobacillus sp. BBL2006]|nr:anti-repressor SinI family protein [Halobacillus sp. BBL2006]